MTAKIFTASILLVSAVNIFSQQDSVFYPVDLMVTIEKTRYEKLKLDDTVYTAQKETIEIDDIHSIAFLGSDSLVINYETGQKINKPRKWYDIFRKKDEQDVKMETVFKNFGINRITGARIKSGSLALAGAGAGLLTGTGLGYLMGKAIWDKSRLSESDEDLAIFLSAFLGGVTGGAVGWLIGSKIGLYEYLTLSGFENKDKCTKLIRFIRQYE